MNRPLLRSLLALLVLAPVIAYSASEEKPVPTVVECTGPSEFVSTATESTYTLTDHVVVTATNMRLTCDHLVIVAKRIGDPKATFDKVQDFKSLIATGHVVLVQTGREATCDRAEVLPGEDKATLYDHVIVRWPENKVEQHGAKATLLRGQMRAIIEGTADQPNILIGPSIKDLGPGKDKGAEEKPVEPTTPAPVPAPTPK